MVLEIWFVYKIIVVMMDNSDVHLSIATYPTDHSDIPLLTDHV